MVDLSLSNVSLLLKKGYEKSSRNVANTGIQNNRKYGNMIGMHDSIKQFSTQPPSHIVYYGKNISKGGLFTELYLPLPSYSSIPRTVREQEAVVAGTLLGIQVAGIPRGKKFY